MQNPKVIAGRFFLLLVAPFLPFCFVTKVTQESQTLNSHCLVLYIKNIWKGRLRSFNCDRFVYAAKALQDKGRKEAEKCLKGLGSEIEDLNASLILCNMLFEPKNGLGGQAPKLGEAIYLGGADETTFPSDPIVFVDGVPFLVVIAYITNRYNEDAGERQVSWFVDNWQWRSTRYHSLTITQKTDALNSLVKSTAWNRPLTEFEIRFLADQIK